MSRLPWFRMYFEARTDRKLATLNDHEFRVWFNLLCFAAEQDERGVIPSADDYMLAIEVGASDGDDLRLILDKLERLRIVARDPDWDADNWGGDDDYGYRFGEVRFIHFKDRNHDKPSDQPERVNERVTRHRQNKREALQEDVTPVKRPVTPRNTLDKSREEIDKRRTTASPLPPSEKRLPSLYAETLNGSLPKLESMFHSIDELFTPAWLAKELADAAAVIGPLSREQLGRGLDIAVKQIERQMAAKTVRNPRPFAHKLIVDYLTEQRDEHHAA